MSRDKTPRIAFLDDIPSLREEMVAILEGAGLAATALSDPYEAIAKAERRELDLLITSLVMKPLGGFEVIRGVRGVGSDVPIIMLTSYGTEQSAIEANRLGIADYLTKPIASRELVARVRRVLKGDAEGPVTLAKMISSDSAMEAIFEKARVVASSESRILILGETGCGKQLLAHAIHEHSGRAKAPFVEVNCAAIPSGLLESELFGHEPGAFTGATKRRIGRFEAAGHGTIFLDEIGELSFDLQSKLLHVLEGGRFTRVGGNDDLKSQARLVTATNRDLHVEVEQGRFRADLFYRLNVISLTLPALRERPGDIMLLAEHFLKKFLPEGRRPPRFSNEAVQVLTTFPWPGNVRELQNVAEQIAVLHVGTEINVADLPQRIVHGADQATSPTVAAPSGNRSFRLEPFRDARDRFEREYLTESITAAGGNLAEAARRAGLDRAQFFRLAKKHGLSSNARR
ncbi:sigma-54-dependent transcriptional regulator [Stratiformator vulcanicus]|uniref:Transcriptional regulatory protein ZraR n=1 Tax=Stratiformator vulcanicus TaxID=2527980 RepID=A0A517QWN8_9PLAN|nr:sigma-54 dependent transcriptional regulator [Stratiformator vulcanicus]QDT36079.1 Transcriptional regulatory protein ZraR [Stratiformator vulcanicus]